MRRLMTVAALIFALAAMGGVNSIAQERRFDLTKIPVEGQKYQDFLPPRWEIKHHAGYTVEESDEFATGDLNGDGKDDVAFVMNVVAAEDVYYGPILIVLLRTENGRLRRAGVNDQLINGASYDNFGVTNPPGVEIKKGVLIVRQELISNGLSDIDRFMHRFRYDAGSGRLLLIGSDADFDDQKGMRNGWRVSENYPTGERVTTKKIPGPGDRGYMGNYSRQVDTRSSIARQRIFLEDAKVDSRTLNRLTGR
jgi:hypothetical protein